MWYLWENTHIFTAFVDDYIIKECEAAYSTQESRKADRILYMAVHNMFIEPTSQL